MQVYPTFPLLSREPEISTFIFYLEDEIEEDMLHVLGSGICTLIVHNSDSADEDIANLFALDLADYQMGDMLADCYGSISEFEKEYSYCSVTLRKLIHDQGALLNSFVTSSDGIARCFYMVKPKMIHISIQEGLSNVDNPTMMSIQSGIEYYNAYANTLEQLPDY